MRSRPAPIGRGIRRLRSPALGVAALVLVGSGTGVADAGGPAVGWRGDGTGRFPDARPATTWDLKRGTNVQWRTPMPSWTNASPIVVGDLIFTTSEPDLLVCVRAGDGAVLWQRDSGWLDLRPGRDADRLRPVWQRGTAALHRQWVLAREKDGLTACLRAAPEDADLKARRGRIEADLAEAAAEAKAAFGDLAKAADLHVPVWGLSVGFSAPTPTSDGRRVFAKFGTGVVAGFDLDGRRLWTTAVPGVRADEPGASSPLLVAGRLVLTHSSTTNKNMSGGPGKPQAVTALDPETGRVAWRHDPIPGVGWGSGSPVAVRLGETDVVVTQGGHVVRASDGRPLAQKVGRGGSSTSVVEGDTVFFLEEFGRRRMAAVRLVPDGEGALRAETRWNIPYFEGRIHHMDWTTAILASPVLHGGRLYGVMQIGRLMVYDASDGRLVGETAVMPPPGDGAAGAVCWPSPALAGGHLFIAERGGGVAIVRPGDSPEVVGRARLPEELRSSPVFAGGRMIVRTVESLLAIAKGNP